jgi:hypothetical protein
MASAYSSAHNGDLTDDDEPTFSLPRHAQPTGYLDMESIEVSSMDKPISNSNIGFKLMLKMGWKEGKGLGSKQQGNIMGNI